MQFQCQQQALANLKQVCDADRHSIVIAGASGNGKTHLVKEWAKMLNINDLDQTIATLNAVASSIGQNSSNGRLESDYAKASKKLENKRKMTSKTENAFFITCLLYYSSYPSI